MTWPKRNTTTTPIDETQRKDGSIAAERVGFLIGKRVEVRLWWTAEAQAASPSGDLLIARLMDVVPIGRDYYFVFASDGENPKRSIIKSAAVLSVSEIDPT
jgi:hypothetical protein